MNNLNSNNSTYKAYLHSSYSKAFTNSNDMIEPYIKINNDPKIISKTSSLQTSKQVYENPIDKYPKQNINPKFFYQNPPVEKTFLKPNFYSNYNRNHNENGLKNFLTNMPIPQTFIEKNFNLEKIRSNYTLEIENNEKVPTNSKRKSTINELDLGPIKKIKPNQENEHKNSYEHNNHQIVFESYEEDKKNSLNYKKLPGVSHNIRNLIEETKKDLIIDPLQNNFMMSFSMSNLNKLENLNYDSEAIEMEIKKFKEKINENIENEDLLEKKNGKKNSLIFKWDNPAIKISNLDEQILPKLKSLDDTIEFNEESTYFKLKGLAEFEKSIAKSKYALKKSIIDHKPHLDEEFNFLYSFNY